MHIARITVWARELPVIGGPYVYAGHSLDHLRTVILRLETTTGVVGWGETCPLGTTYSAAFADGVIAALKLLAQGVLGQEVLPRPVVAKMDTCLNGQSQAKAAIDIAVWDAFARACGQPLHAVLGGALRNRIPSYYAIGIMSPEDTSRAVAQKVSEGYTAIQLKVGSGDVTKDAAALRAGWGALSGGTSLTADANRALSIADAMQLSRLVADLPVAFEQPCATQAELRDLSTKVSHPIFWDESTEDVGVTMAALAQGHAQGLGMKITRVGGLSQMPAIRDMAAARCAPMSVDDHWGGDIIAAACVHFGATVTPELFRGTWLAQPYIGQHYGPKGITIDNGWIDVPTGPGLGIDPDVDALGAALFEVTQ